MSLFQIFTIIGLVFTVSLGVFNLIISFKNRRNALREHVFKEQIMVLLGMMRKISILENIVEDLNREWSDNKQLSQAFMNEMNALDEIQSSNSILLPHNLYLAMNEFSKFLYSYSKNVFAEPDKITSDEKKKFSHAVFELEEKFREHIGLDELTEENRRIILRRKI